MQILTIFIFLFLFIFFCYRSYEKRKIIKSVTDLSRGESSERDLIWRLVKECGFNPKAIYHDLYLRKRNGNYAQIDLAMPTPQGIIVFEVKDYGGWIFGNEKSKYWMQIMAYGRERHQFYNPIKQNSSHIDAIKELLPNNPDVLIFNVVVFYGRCVFKKLDYDNSGKTRVLYYSDLKRILPSIRNLAQCHYGNKMEVIKVLKEGVKNGSNPEIVRAHRDQVYSMCQNNKSYHTFNTMSSPFRIFR